MSVRFALIVPMLGFAGHTLAQEAEPSTSRPAGAIEEVVVTAQKRSERLLDVPLSVTALDVQALTDQNLVKLSDYYARIPGLSYAGNLINQLSLRGISTGGGTNPTVAVTIDDVPFGSSQPFGSTQTPDLDPAILQRIEVLRGPQGTLYGASSLGGLIKYVTKAPDTRELSGSVELSGQSVAHGDNGYSARAQVNVPLVADKAAMRVSGFYREDPAFIDNTLADVEDANILTAYGGRVALFVQPSESLTVDLSALMQREDRKDPATVDLLPGNRPRTGDLEHASGPGLVEAFSESALVQLNVSADLGIADLISVTGYSESRDDTVADATSRYAPGLFPLFGIVGARVPFASPHSTDKWSQEFRLASPGNEKVEWLLGAFYTKEESNNSQRLVAVDAATGATVANFISGDQPMSFEEKAAFGAMTYHFTDKFDVQVGGRLSRNDQEFAQIGTGLLICQPLPPTPACRAAGGGSTASFGSSSENAVTWLFTPQYHFSDDVMGYLRMATGYRPGGPNTAVPGTPPSYESDSTVNYELGLKGSALDNRVTFDAAVYWIEWKDIILGLVNPVSQLVFFGNGETARSRGLEASAAFNPWAGMTLAMNATLSDAELTSELPRASTTIGGPGDRLPYSAKVSGNFSAQQDFPLGSTATAYFGGTVSYVGERLSSFAAIHPSNPPRYRLPSYTVLDLRAGVRFDAWSVNLFARNVTDERGFVAGNLTTPTIAANGALVTVLQPRTVGLSISHSF